MTEKQHTNKVMISLNISKEEFKKWSEGYKELGYSTKTNMIRDAVNSLFLPKELTEPTTKIDTSKLEKEIKEMRKENHKSKMEMLALNREMLKLLAETMANGKTAKTLTIEESIVNLAGEKGIHLGAFSKYLGLPESQVLERLNELVRKDLLYLDLEDHVWRRI